MSFETRADKALMIIQGRIDQMAEHLFPAPAAFAERLDSARLRYALQASSGRFDPLLKLDTKVGRHFELTIYQWPPPNEKGDRRNFARANLLNLDSAWGENCVCPLFLDCRGLKRSRTEQKLDNIALMRLQPVEFQGRNRSQIQSIDLRRVD